MKKAILEAEEVYIDTTEDALFSSLMDEYMCQEGRRFIAMNEQLEANPAAAVPKEVEQRGLELIEKAIQERNGK